MIESIEWTRLYFPLAFAFSFLLGSLPFGLWIGRVFNVNDVRAHGSGNIGATNVSRVAGFWPAGFLTFALDVAKGILAIVAFGHMSETFWQGIEQLSLLQIAPKFSWYLGIAAVLGHCYSPWLSMKGGKGVATGFGVIAILSPIAAATGIAAFLIAFFSRRIGSLASLAGLSGAAVAQFVIEPVTGSLVPFLFLIGLVVVRHEANISALLESKERAF